MNWINCCYVLRDNRTVISSPIAFSHVDMLYTLYKSLDIVLEPANFKNRNTNGGTLLEIHSLKSDVFSLGMIFIWREKMSETGFRDFGPMPIMKIIHGENAFDFQL